MEIQEHLIGLAIGILIGLSLSAFAVLTLITFISFVMWDLLVFDYSYELLRFILIVGIIFGIILYIVVVNSMDNGKTNK